MAKYTRKDIICFTDDPRLENAIGKLVYVADCPTNLLTFANNDLWPETLAIIHKDADSCPFSTYVESPWYNNGYKHYDAIIIKKDEEENIV